MATPKLPSGRPLPTRGEARRIFEEIRDLVVYNRTNRLSQFLPLDKNASGFRRLEYLVYWCFSKDGRTVNFPAVRRVTEVPHDFVGKTPREICEEFSGAAMALGLDVDFNT